MWHLNPPPGNWSKLAPRWSSIWLRAASPAAVNGSSSAPTVPRRQRSCPARPPGLLAPPVPRRPGHRWFRRLGTWPWHPDALRARFKSGTPIGVSLLQRPMGRNTLGSWSLLGNLMDVCIESSTKTWCSTDCRPMWRRRPGITSCLPRWVRSLCVAEIFLPYHYIPILGNGHQSIHRD